MNYRREIDGLRALAVLPVMLFHAGLEAFSGGFVGVDVFFVISGYLITSILLKELEQGRFSIVNFYERRARRILPALVLVMLLCIPFAWLWLLPSDLKDFSQSLIAVSVFASNILFWLESGYFDTAAELKPLLHTWSLAVEEQYYVLFPLLLMWFWKLGRRWLLGLLAVLFCTSLAFAQWAAHAQPDFAFYLLPTRGWELLIGAFAAFYLSKRRDQAFGRGLSEVFGWLGVALIAYAVIFFSKSTPFPGFFALVPTVGAVLIILFATQQTMVGRFVGNKAFVGIGLISYSAYLWHQPLFAFARHRSLVEPGAGLFLLLSALALLLAYFSWRYVEGPFRAKGVISRKNNFIFSACSTAAFLSLGIYGHMNNGFKERFGARLDRFLAAKTDTNPRRAQCHFSSDKFPSPENYCVLGAGKTVGMLLGDSHADAVSYALSKNLAQKGVALLSATYSGCPPVENMYRVDQKVNHKCFEFNKQSLDYATTNKSIEYVVLIGRWSIYLDGAGFNNGEGGVEKGQLVIADAVAPYGSRIRSNDGNRRQMLGRLYINSIARLLNAGKKVILVYPIPEVGFDVPGRLVRLKSLGIEDAVTTSHKVYQDRNRQVFDLFDSIGSRENLFRIYPDKIFCDTVVRARCVTEVDGKVLYYDDDHLTNAGSEFVAKEIVNHVRNHEGR